MSGEASPPVDTEALRATAEASFPGRSSGSYAVPPWMRDVVVAHGAGSRFYTTIGDRYLGYIPGSGPLVLGHAHPRVAPDLRARGHAVHAPTLTGLGEREHLLGADVDLEVHAVDVANLLAFEDVARAVVVGHGYGGAVAQRVATLSPERVGRLLWLDALLTRDGAALLDVLGAAAAALEARAYDDEGVPVYAPDAGLLLDGLVKRDADWVEDRLTPMPAAPYAQPVALAPRTGPALAVGEAVARELDHRCEASDSPHLPMIARPEPAAVLIDNVARQPAARRG